MADLYIYIYILYIIYIYYRLYLENYGPCLVDSPMKSCDYPMQTVELPGDHVQ